MKIKKFKLNLKIKEVYNNLKQNNIKITPEIETMVSIVSKEISEYIIPAITTETFDVKDNKISWFTNNVQIPKNVVYVTFIVATLGDKVEQYLSSISEEVKKSVTLSILNAYLNSALDFIIQILDEKKETDVEHGTLFTLDENFYPETLGLLSSDKIGVFYEKESKKLSPCFTTINYMFWFKKK